MRLQWSNRLKAFFEQKNHPPHHDEPRNLGDVILHLQLPHAVERRRSSREPSGS